MGGAENAYEGTLQIQQADALNLVVYKRRELTLAVHAITLINDDVDSGIKLGEGKPNSFCIKKGQGQGILWTSVTGGDDQLVFGGITTGVNGICETQKTDARDAQTIEMGKGEPGAVIVQPGPNGVLNTASNGTGIKNIVAGVTLDDDEVVGETITTGADGIRETPLVKPIQEPVNVPTKAEIKAKLDKIFGKQANIFFDVKYVQAANVAYDVGDQAGAYPQHVEMKNPNGRFDYFPSLTTLSPEETLVKAAAYDVSVDFNLYYFGSGIAGFYSLNGNTGKQFPVGFARAKKKRPYIRAYDIYAINAQDQASSSLLSSIAAHELAHNDLLENNTGLGHPREPIFKNGQKEYIPFDSKNNYTLLKESDDRKRLMWPEYVEDAVFPELLLKDECDRLQGVTTKQ